MFLQQWHQRLTGRFAGTLPRGRTQRPKKFHRQLLLERLEERLVPVVGARFMTVGVPSSKFQV